MYRGKRFTREQLLFVVQTIFRAAADQIQSALPPIVPISEANERHTEITNIIHGAVNAVGTALPILYAQLTNDGLGIGEFPQFEDFKQLTDKYVVAQFGLEGEFNMDGTFPDTDALAESFVDEFLMDYIVAAV